MSFLLDTNIVIAVLNQESAALSQLISKTVFLCSIVLGELNYGARKFARSIKNLAKIETFVVDYQILDCTK